VTHFFNPLIAKTFFEKTPTRALTLKRDLRVIDST